MALGCDPQIAVGGEVKAKTFPAPPPKKVTKSYGYFFLHVWLLLPEGAGCFVLINHLNAPEGQVNGQKKGHFPKESKAFLPPCLGWPHSSWSPDKASG